MRNQEKSKGAPTGTPEQPQEEITELPMEDPSSALLRELSSIKPSKIAMAEKLGFPAAKILDRLGQYVTFTEARFQAIQEQMPQQIQKAMRMAIEDAQRQQLEQMQNIQAQAGQGGRNVGELARILRLVGAGGGGGEDEYTKKLVRETMEMNLLRMKQDMSFTESIKTAIVGKIAGKAASKLIEE